MKEKKEEKKSGRGTGYTVRTRGRTETGGRRRKGKKTGVLSILSEPLGRESVQDENVRSNRDV